VRSGALVVGTANGVPIRTRLAVYGAKTYLVLTKDVREAAGLELGDRVTVVLERDDAPRVVYVPAELTTALRGDAVASEVFERLSFTTARSTPAGSRRPSVTRPARRAWPSRLPCCATP
jgi:hypothetical protein